MAIPRTAQTRIVLRLAAPLLAALWLLLPARTAHADAVVGTGNPASCTHAALSAALLQGGLITFNCGPNPHTIIITATRTITTSLVLDGGSQITLSGGGAVRLFIINSGHAVTFRNLTLSNGLASGHGGAIFSNGHLTVEDSTLQNNNTTADFNGGAIRSTGALTITRSSFINNSAGSGGALYPLFENAHTHIRDSHFINNRTTSASTASGWGGAVLLWDGAPVTISNTTFVSNTARVGGALYVHAENLLSQLTITNSQFISNTAVNPGGTALGGAIYNAGRLSMTGALLRVNRAQTTYGGALMNAGAATATLVDNVFLDNLAGEGGAIRAEGSWISIRGGLFSGNHASLLGGAIHNFTQLHLADVTFTGNSENVGSSLTNHVGADLILTGTTLYSNTSGLWSSGRLTMTNSTISGNSEHGIFIDTGAAPTAHLANVTIANNGSYGLHKTGAGAATLVLTNTLLAGNVPGNCSLSAALTFNSQFSLSSDNTCAWTGTGNQANASAGLRPLGDYGGPTPTHMLQLSSAALNTGTGVGCPATDQRGVLRPQGPACDIGAIEATALDLLYRLFLPLIRR